MIKEWAGPHPLKSKDLILETWTALAPFPNLFQRNSPLESNSHDGRQGWRKPFEMYLFFSLKVEEDFSLCLWKWLKTVKIFKVSLFRMSKLSKWWTLANRTQPFWVLFPWFQSEEEVLWPWCVGDLGPYGSFKNKVADSFNEASKLSVQVVVWMSGAERKWGRGSLGGRQVLNPEWPHGPQ